MHWTSNYSGRFPELPYYSACELDHLCEQLITTLLGSRHGHVAFPVATADLTVLIEYLGATLDASADLSAEERMTHGCTVFIPGCRPLVRIARRLSANPRYQHRLWIALTHVCAHVWLHRPVSGAWSRSGHLFGDGHRVVYRCEPTTMLRAHVSNWAEWQAGYVSGALLMPVSALREVIRQFLKREQVLRGPFPVSSPAGQALVREVVAAFAVSEEAARVRLLQRAMLTEDAVVQGQLFT
jgi:hypothetical protein